MFRKIFEKVCKKLNLPQGPEQKWNFLIRYLAAEHYLLGNKVVIIGDVEEFSSFAKELELEVIDNQERLSNLPDGNFIVSHELFDCKDKIEQLVSLLDSRLIDDNRVGIVIDAFSGTTVRV